MKRTPTRTMNVEETLDAETAELRGHLPEIDATAQAEAAESTKARKFYEALEYQKHLGDTDIDETTVAHAYTTWKTAERQALAAEMSRTRLLEDLKKLEGQRADAKRADAEAALVVIGPAFVVLSEDLDRLVGELAEKLGAWRDQALQRHGLARKAGRSIGLTPSTLATTVMLSRLAFLSDLPRPISDAPELTSFQSIARRFYVPRNDDDTKEDAALRTRSCSTDSASTS